jgi:5-methylcytosine-specific restriction endonuclease McrA
LPCDAPEWSNFTRFFAQNFERLGLKRLISTYYAVESKKYKDYEPISVRLFDDPTKKAAYREQTTKAEGKGILNCLYCAIGHGFNRMRIWMLSEMDADHVRAWSKDGNTDRNNCQMLCKTHNRAKGNRRNKRNRLNYKICISVSE